MLAFGGLNPVPRVCAQESEAELPDLMGDNFDGGVFNVAIDMQFNVEFHALGTFIPNTNQNLLALERDGVGFPDDLFAIPLVDANGMVVPNTFMIIGEPTPPSEVPTAPPGFSFDGGQAVFTGSTSETTPATTPPPAADGIYFVNYSFSQQQNVLIPAGGGGVAVRRVKITENNNPLPQDRVFFNYNFFNNVPGGLNDVNRYTLGIEKTFHDGIWSFDFRLPFAATLDADQTLGTLGARGTELGNVVLIGKLLLLQSSQLIWSAGSGVTFPTANPTELFMGNTNILKVNNETLHVLPFTAVSWSTDPKFYVQAFLQFDLDPFGNRIYGDVPEFQEMFNGRRDLPQIGRLNDSSLLFVDLALGTRIYDNPGSTGIKRVSAVAEFHYGTTLQDADTVAGNGLNLTDLSPRTDILNLTLANHILYGDGYDVASGFVLPLRRGADLPFDFEFLLQMTKFY